MKPRTPVYITLLIVFVILFIVYYMFVQNTSFLSSPYYWLTIGISAVLVFIQNAIGDLVENDKFKKLTPEAQAEYLAETKVPYFTRLYNAAFKKQSATEEKDILIDHGFDGIMELDNQLPKWWLGLFYFGLFYCIIYITSYAFTDFAHPIKEYDNEYKEQLAAIEIWKAITPPPTIDNAKYSADNIKEGEEIFKTNCVTCHMDGGKGGIGPNLTDNFWKNQPEKTLFKNVFHVVENGVPGTQMQAWGKNGVITGFDIEKVSAYIYHINQEQAPITQAQGGAAPYGTEAKWEK